MNKEKLVATPGGLKGKNQVKEKYFVPKDDESYFYVWELRTPTPTVLERVPLDSEFDKESIKIGNCFRTKEEAIFAGKCEYYTKRFETYITRHSKELDWSNEAQAKYSVYCDYESNDIFYGANWTNSNIGVTYASSRQILDDAIADIGKENFLKYVMRINK